MVVFPEKMYEVNIGDMPGAMSAVVRYIRYMCERITFAVGAQERAIAKLQEAAPAIESLAETAGTAGQITVAGGEAYVCIGQSGDGQYVWKKIT